MENRTAISLTDEVGYMLGGTHWVEWMSLGVFWGDGGGMALWVWHVGSTEWASGKKITQLLIWEIFVIVDGSLRWAPKALSSGLTRTPIPYLWATVKVSLIPPPPPPPVYWDVCLAYHNPLSYGYLSPTPWWTWLWAWYLRSLSSSPLIFNISLP